MSENLDIHIVDEGIEEQMRIDLLRELQRDMVQGYCYSKPMTADDFTKPIRTSAKFGKTNNENIMTGGKSWK